MKRTVLIILITSIIISMSYTQTERYKPEVVKEFPISSDASTLFSEPIEKAYEYFGVHLACDMSGRLYLLDYDKEMIYMVSDSDFSIVKSFKVSPFPYDTLFSGDKNGFYYVSMSGFYQYIQYDGTVVFWGDLRDVMSFTPKIDITSSLYHAGILFFMDNQNQIHCIINPSIDTSQNKKNYRNPEQTKDLFQQDSGVDLGGLRIGNKGLYFLNDTYIGPYFQPVIGKWKYSVNSLGSDVTSIIIGSLTQILIRFKVDTASEEEMAEGFAVHPSGDIYILRYNMTKKAHVLLRFDNSWDIQEKKEWDRQHKASQY